MEHEERTLKIKYFRFNLYNRKHGFLRTKVNYNVILE